MIVIGFDPGYTTGVARFAQEGDGLPTFTGFHHWSFPTLSEELSGVGKADLVVIEDFKLLPYKAQSLVGTGFEQTIQAIGMIKQWAYSVDAKVVMQSPRIKTIAQKWTKVVPVGDHKNSHWMDAYNHAKYYMIKNDMDFSVYSKELAIRKELAKEK